MVEPQTPPGVLHKFISYRQLGVLGEFMCPSRPTNKSTFSLCRRGVQIYSIDAMSSSGSPPHCMTRSHRNPIYPSPMPGPSPSPGAHHSYPTRRLGLIFRNVGVGTDLSDVVTSWLSPKPHLECFTNTYHIYMKYCCTLISCGLVYEPQAPLGVLHKFISCI